MRLAYVCYVRAFAPDGVNDKISRQVAWWRAAGHEVTVYALSVAADPGAAEPQAAEPQLPARVYAFGSLPDRVRATVAVARAVRRLAPDAVYLRYDRYVPPLPPMLWPLPMAIEINTDDTLETRFWGPVHWLYNELNRRVTLPFARGFVAVTHELARARSFSRFGKPTIVIANGADPEPVPQSPPAAATGRPSAVMLVGSIGPWVGLDRAVGLARALPELDVHLVGCTPADLEGPLPDNLVVHGLLQRSEYRPLLARATFGIGPLAVHRKGMDEASPLKVREYLVHGLPVLVAHTDTDFVGHAPWYLLQIPNAEGNVEAAAPAIRSWLQAVSERRVPARSAAERVGMDRKEAARLAFVAAVAGRDVADADMARVAPGG